jgi:hypothetical protein
MFIHRLIYVDIYRSSPLPSDINNDESNKLINHIFGLICDLTNDEAKIVRVQAMKMIVGHNEFLLINTNNRDISRDNYVVMASTLILFIKHWIRNFCE